MKRINFSIITLLVIAMTLVFASCTKDGVYKPKKKISQIYETNLTDPTPERVLAETWTWNGKLLSKVDYGDGDVVTFTYEKNQLTAVYSEDARTELTYDGKFIDNMKVYYDGELYMTSTFQHEKNLVSGYTVEYAGTDANKAQVARVIENTFRFIAPEVARAQAEAYVSSASSNIKANSKYTVSFTYDGKNVIEQTTVSENYKVVYQYTYTEYNNPFYGLISKLEFSKNAPASLVIKQDGMPDYNYSYTYKVDGKVPTQVVENLSWSVGAMSHNESIQTDYEFVK